MMKLETTGKLFDFNRLGTDFIESIAAGSVAKISNEFAAFMKGSRFAQYFESGSGETEKSIGVYRTKSKKPVFVVKAGLGIRGQLNYLAGLYRGQAVSRSGKVFNFARKRNMIDEGWNAFGGDSKMKNIYEDFMKRKLKEAEAKLEG